jgi:hypothetical protein
MRRPLAHLAVILGCVSTVYTTTVALPVPSAAAMSEQEAFKKFETTYGFILVNQQGAPLGLSNPDSKDSNQAVFPVFLSYQQAQGQLDQLKKTDAKRVQDLGILILPVSLNEILSKSSDARKQKQEFMTPIVPDQTQLKSAIEILKKRGMKESEINSKLNSAPIFFVALTESTSKTDRLIASFDQEAVQAFISQIKKENPNIKGDAAIDVTTFALLLDRLTSQKEDVDSVIPTLQSIQVMEAIKQNSKTNGSRRSK